MGRDILSPSDRASASVQHAPRELFDGRIIVCEDNASGRHGDIDNLCRRAPFESFDRRIAVEIRKPAAYGVFRFAEASLARHGDADGVLRGDEVVRVLSGLGNGELDALHSAVERVAARTVVWGNGSAAILADIAAVIGGEDHRLSHGYGALADLLAVDNERRLAALPRPPPA
jgi:hypothetical protein